MSAAVEAAIARADAVVEAASAEVVDPGTKPFTRWSPPPLLSRTSTLAVLHA